MHSKFLQSLTFLLFWGTLCLLIAFLAPIISPQNPYDLTQLYLQNSHMPPTLLSKWSYEPFVLGSDGQGRCMYSAILYGLRISLYVGLSSTVISAVFGTLLGLVAGYVGGRTDALIMRIADIQLSFPIWNSDFKSLLLISQSPISSNSRGTIKFDFLAGRKYY